jgi:hypothetical protein
MKQVTTLQITKYRSFYNEVVRTKLENSNIKYMTKDIRGGYKILVNENDFLQAIKIISSVSFTNPKY